MSPIYDPDAEVAQGAQSEKMPTGRHDVTIAKVIVDKGGNPWKTKKGDRQILVIFENDGGQEASAFFPVEGAARWRLAQLWHGIGENTASLKAKGFTDPTTLCVGKIADHWLLKKRLQIDVEFDGKYHDVEIVMPEQVEPGSGIGKPPPREDVPYDRDSSIPF